MTAETNGNGKGARIFSTRKLDNSRVRSLMEAKGWTQRQLGQKVKAGPAQISRWLTGEAQPRTSKVIALARVLGVERESLLLPEGK